MALGEGSKLAYSEPSSMYPQGLAQVPTPREVTLRERVMQHEQRILELEKYIVELRTNLEKLVDMLVNQIGLVV